MTDWNSNHVEALLERLVLAAEAIAARLPLPAVTSTPADSAPQPDADDWIEHDGKRCPIGDTIRHQRRYRDGMVGSIGNNRSLGLTESWVFSEDGPRDIIAYRVVPE